MTAAFLIIDVQQALCSGEYEAFDIRGVIDRINLASSKAREAGALVVLIQHESEDGPLAYGTPGWQLADGLAVRPGDLRIRKQATDSFHNTDLKLVLDQHAVDHLIICGLQSEFCVDTTTRRALALGYSVTLVSDGHSTIDNGVLRAAQISAHHNETLANITSFGPRVHLVPAGELRVSGRKDG
jgi:nicotinamidase-related amidase